jgi:hypothetical protein
VTDPIAEALDEFVPAFQSAEGDWQAIVNAATMPTAVVPADRQSRHRLVRAWHTQRRRRPLLVAVALLGFMALAAAAIAVGLGAFNGIGAAQHPQTSADVIDPATAAYLKDHLAGIRLDTARHIGQLPDGQNIYVVTGTQNDLCTVVGPPNAFVQCGDPLSNSHPATITGDYAVNNDPSIRWVIFGLALDGVTSVSFQPTQADGGGPAGPEVTVPVNDNLWIYKSNDASEVDVLQPFTAHFADGTTVVEPATGKDCAAC